jgi:hypothetical protein
VIVCAPGLCRPSGCSPAAPRPAWRRRRTARILVVADAQPAAAGQPGDRAFHLPAVAAEPGRWLHGTAGDPHPDPLPREVAAAAAVVVGLVGVDLVGSIAPSTPGRTDLGDVVQQGLEDCRSGVLAAVISSDSGNPVPSAARWSLHPGLARSTSPRTARRLKESTVTRAQSSAPTAPSSSSRSCCSRSNTPARAHSANRRPQLVTLPQPNSRIGSSAHGVEVRAMNRTAAMQARSETVRGAPPRAWDGGWQQGWMRCHSASAGSRSARVVVTGSLPTTDSPTPTGRPGQCHRWVTFVQANVIRSRRIAR